MTAALETPIGRLSVDFADGYLLSIREYRKTDTITGATRSGQAALNELEEYFCGKRKIFQVPVLFHGTPFQEAVWNALMTIPYGETRSYGDIAKMIGHSKAVRAVGTAVGHNPIPIIIPCHRVIRSDGCIGNFSLFGPEAKKWLLDSERATCHCSPKQE